MIFVDVEGGGDIIGMDSKGPYRDIIIYWRNVKKAGEVYTAPRQGVHHTGSPATAVKLGRDLAKTLARKYKDTAIHLRVTHCGRKHNGIFSLHGGKFYRGS